MLLENNGSLSLENVKSCCHSLLNKPDELTGSSKSIVAPQNELGISKESEDKSEGELIQLGQQRTDEPDLVGASKNMVTSHRSMMSFGPPK